ncbi:uncharacterized protein DSM5745_10318 [Aspergillus mulundensis]|uniref:Uncharacterized protein n=1 Tax=Aspergillus mulundensis TaxID=1810919 RepID=A0A3D8QN37_9EURO|nr:Uncharacterized protein DSM5745_10318 [Aspergillus mulundensis]RDW63207.1 Uncharacterized protein DSM5745_10318 [Aspergillus mulundensis]
MPTATSTIGWTLANVGPAPTTYSPAPSCTAGNTLIVGWDNPYESQWGINCNSVPDNCWPTPTASSLIDDIKTNEYIVPFYSPGLSCPSGWQAIGQIAHPTATDELVTSSGIYSVSQYPDFSSGDLIKVYNPEDAFGALLDPGETMFACCPSSFYTESYRTGCFSPLPSTPSTGCSTEYATRDVEVVTTPFLLNGTTTTAQLLLPMSTPPSSTLLPTTFSDVDEMDVYVLSSMGHIYLVHRPSDRDSQASASGTAAPTDASGSDAEATGTNAASALRAGEKFSWGQVTGVVGVLTLSLLAGMGLVLPW